MRTQSVFARLRQTEMVAIPCWFTAALAQKPDHFDVDVEGCRIHMRAWGDKRHPPLVLVHGGGAHSGWWDHIAPFFSRTHRVIAPDLSGHGDSQSRPAYDLGTWAREALAAPKAAGASGQPTIVGHSLGGWVTATAARHYGQQIDSIVVIDSPLRDRAPEAARLRNRKNHDDYRTRDEIIARFRAVPSQEVTLPYIAHHIAVDSVRKANGRWIWKFDPAIFRDRFDDQTPAEEEIMEDLMTQMPCRIGYLRCEAGLVPPVMAERIRSILQLRGPYVELADAGHHPVLDQPLPLVATLRTLLEFWSIT
ncbi:alpha/beta hydrolase [Mycobacterium colombiense]|uniref:alpha/beta fold hydrolase n=1 Tax=Mycobacterium colombiense TaxID=339268 RepID=UPI0007F03FE6|nr:alpha/beta hydrolase [Mycobacterium colombiense]OBK63229.1 alpha/beta hydrolase [Mycobacterium colombiense]